ncbi:MAG TPA: hypothetical protein VGK73_01785 [Polyangiaceae bacterium]
MKRGIVLGIALGLGIVGTAYAVPSTSTKVKKVAVADRTKVYGDTSSEKQLTIWFQNPTEYCGEQGVGSVTIISTYSSEWANWVRLAEAAVLSGQTLTIDVHASTSTNCRPWRISLGS